jgi:hypothetical protein
VVDSNSETGNESVSWKHYDKFNDLFGNKASTRVEASFDTTGGSQIKEITLISFKESSAFC